MIYSMYWNGLNSNGYGVPTYWNEYLMPQYAGKEYAKYRAIAKYAGKSVDLKQMLADFIIKSEDSSFCYVVTKDQEREFLEFLKKYKLIDLVVYQMPDFVTNANHAHYKRRLKLYVICSPNHFWRDMYEEEDEQMENSNGN